MSFYLFLIFYFVLILSIIFYLLPTIINFKKFYSLKNKSIFFYLKGINFWKIFLFFIFYFLFFIFTWSFPTTSLWFGHLIMSTFSCKILYFVFFFFIAILYTQTLNLYLASKDVFDFFITMVNFFVWIFLLFLTNNIFSAIFIIEILSTLIFLLLITSTFSTAYFFNNLNLNIYNYLNNSFPFFFNQTVLFFFWTSLLASLNLFLSILFFYLKFFSFDWFFFEKVFYFLITSASFKDVSFLLFVWFNFLFCIFLKCGLVPFYAWKPTFFKGSSINFLYNYICFFYFFIFLFFIKLLLLQFNEIFFFFLIVNFLMLITGFVLLLAILSETFYLKTFFAISSILNTLFIFLAFSSYSSFDFFFNL